MKNILILCAVMLISASTFGQSLPKGSLIGLHNVSIKLKGSATQAQFLSYINSTWIPAASKAFECEVHVLNHVRGKSENKIGLLFIYKNAAARDKFYVGDGVLSAAGKAASAKMKAADEGLAKLGTTSGSYIDWAVQ